MKSFKKCGISNRHDGTEDDMLWDDVDPPAGDAMDIDSDVEDLYDDMVFTWILVLAIVFTVLCS